MPLSDNLYSRDDSDELGPSDGYVNRGGMSPNNLVQDPSVEDTKVEPKSLIAPPQHSSTGGSSRSLLRTNLPLSSSASHNYAAHHSSNPNASATPSSSCSPPSPRTSGRLQNVLSEHTNLMLNGPPPAYSPSPISAALPEEASGRRYSTFLEQHLERGFLPRPEPQSMGGAFEVADERVPLAGDPNSGQPSRYRKILIKTRRHIKNTLLFLLVLAIVLAVLDSFSRIKSSDPKKFPDGVHPPGPERPVDNVGPYCPTALRHHDLVTYEIPMGTDLTVLQTTHDNEKGRNINVETVGEIRLRRTPKTSKHGNNPYFTVDVWVSHPELEVSKTWDVESRLLKISTPKYTQLGNRSACVSVEITAWFPEDAIFTDILIEAVTLNLRVLEDIEIDVTRRSKFTTITGHVRFPDASDDCLYMPQPDPATNGNGAEITQNRDFKRSAYPFSSRRLLIETVTGSIQGSYPLEDFLGVSSQSGAINLVVVPGVVNPEAPAPADLEIQTSSGSIKAVLPIRDGAHPDYAPPPRNYITRVHSSAGSIDGSYYLGFESNFRSTTGAMNIIVLPVLQNESKNVAKNIFETHTVSGSISVSVLDPIFISPLASLKEQALYPLRPDPFAPVGEDDSYLITPPMIPKSLFTVDPPSNEAETPKLRNLRSVHGANTASVDVRYPDVWEGTVHQKAVSGQVTATGDGIRLVKYRNDFAFKELKARKGVENDGEGCFIEMSDVAGSLKFTVGEAR